MCEVVIDDYLIYYAAGKDRLEREMNHRFGRFRHVTGGMPKSWVGMLKAQYIAHRIFKSKGLIHKYLKHSEIKTLDERSRHFLQDQAMHPWRFSFSEIIDQPAEDFFSMFDVFNDESFLLYSPGVTRTLEDQPGVVLWLNLIGFNGVCWQSYGPFGSYRGFDPDDIFFYATEVNPAIAHEYDLLADIEANPVPYMMLMSGANFPMVFNGEDRLVYNYGWHHQDQFEAESFGEFFKIEYAPGVFRLSLKEWEEPPHFATAYYDEKAKSWLLSSATDLGYQALVNHLSTKLRHLAVFPDIRVGPNMLVAAGKLLRREIQLDPYQEKFPETVPLEASEALGKMNRLLQLALPMINNDEEPDLEALAKEVGLALPEAKELMANAIRRAQELRKRV